MSVSDRLPRAVMERLHNQLMSNTFSDIVVSVQNKKFECHRFILCACSRFFEDACRQLFDENKPSIVIENISPETFRFVQDIIYGGKDVLTVDNVADIWVAAKLLQIDFLYDTCEIFQCDQLTVDNCIQLTIQARDLESKCLTEASCDLIARNFQNVYKSDDFVLLDPVDLLLVISNEHLVAPSEDSVMSVILKWAHHNPKEKAKFGFVDKNKKSKSFLLESQNKSYSLSRKEKASIAADLLNACRLCLASGRSLQTLIDDDLIGRNRKAFAVIREALRYQLQPEKQGYYCPPMALHRRSSNLQSVILGIFRQPNGCIDILCRTIDGTWHKLPNGIQQQNQTEIFAASFYSTLYSTGNYNISHRVLAVNTFKMETGTWQGVTAIPADTHQYAIITQDHYLYAVPVANSTTIKRLNLLDPRLRQWVKAGRLLLSVDQVVLTRCGGAIIILGNEAGSDEITIQSFDTQTMACSTYEKKFNSNGMGVVSFQVAKNSYILLANGELWKLVTCDKQNLKMACKGKLFDDHVNVNSAVVFNDVLIISASQVDPQMPKKWETDCIENVHYVEIIEGQSKCLMNTVIPKCILDNEEGRSVLVKSKGSLFFGHF